MNLQKKKNLGAKDYLAKTLVEMLKRNRLSEIRICQLVERAGVSRSVYYNNYVCKEDILVYYMNMIYRSFDWKYENKDRFDDLEALKSFLQERLLFISDNREFFEVLCKENMLYYVLNHADVKNLCLISSKDAGTEKTIKYRTAIASGIISGLITEWIQSNFFESEDELAEIIIGIFGSMLC